MAARRFGLPSAPRLLVKYWWRLLLAVGLPLVAAVGIEAYFGYNARLEQAKGTQAVQALAAASAIEANLQTEVRYVSQVYRVLWPRDRLRQLADEIEIAQGLFPAILEVSVVREGVEQLFVSQLEPRRIAAGPAPKAGEPRKDLKPRFEAIRHGDRQIPAIRVLIPHDRYEGENLVLTLDSRSLSDLLGQIGRRDRAVIYLVDGKGRVLAHSDPVLAVAGRDMSGHLKESADGIVRVVQPVANTDWLTVVERPLQEVLAPIQRGITRTLALLALGLVAAGLLGAYLAHRLTRPILKLGEDVARIGRGELTHRTGIRTGDEIEGLGAQVNQMATALQEYTYGLERKVAERTVELQSALETAEDAMRARAMFLAAASHDLRQPLYAISILGDALASQALPAETATVVRKQREAIGALRALFDNLLDLSRLDAGEIRPFVRVVALREVLGPLANEYEVQAQAKGLTWRANIGDAWVRTDPELLRRVLSNLLSNAVRYTPRGGIELEAVLDGSDVRIDVIDTGIGIAAEDQARVFEEFVQLGNAARERDQGVGLGLSIVNRIADLLDLRLTMDSAPGRGTRMTIRMAVETALSAAAAAPDAPEAHIAGMRLWVVEDDPLVRSALKVQLEAWQVDFDFAASREELVALHARDGAWPDAAMLDDMLPGAGEQGLELAMWLAEHVGAARIAIVSGNVDPGRTEELAKSGLRVLRKPLSSAQIAAWLEECVRDGQVA